jgi:ornithine cyclodeaminase/alanine dehydrogenase-like protein (mu-crystallin family)
MRLTLLSAQDLRTALPMPAAIEAMKAAYAELSAGQADVPLRTALTVPDQSGLSLFMPARLVSGGLGAKIVSVFPHNPDRGKPIIHGLVVVLDPETGEPIALCDGTFLTAWRTGAAAGAAADLLARPDAETAALIGCGNVGRAAVLAIDAIRPLKQIYVYGLDSAAVQQFVDELQLQVSAKLIAASSANDAVRQADLICTATTSSTPVFDDALLKPGAHISGMGSYTTDMREIDAGVVKRARIFVDSRSAALAEAGDLVIPLKAGEIRSEDWTEIGQVAAGLKPGRQTAQEITFFKSVGVAVQDIAAARQALTAAQAAGLGQLVEF